MDRTPPKPQPDHVAAAPPTEPTGAAEPTEAAQIQKLEKRMRWLIIGLGVCVLLIAAMGSITGLLLQRHAVMIAEQKLTERAQLQLLQDLRSDFEQLEMAPPENRVEAYQQLRGHLNEIQGVYGAIADWDITDPEGSMDRLFESYEERPPREREQREPPPPASTDDDQDSP